MTLPVFFFYGFAFIGLFHSLVFSFVAVKNKQPANLIITFYLLAQSLIILEYVFYWSGLYIRFHYFNNISFPLHFLFGPLLFMYTHYVLNENKPFKKYLPHLIPAIVVLVLMLPYFFSTASLKVYHTKMIPYLFLDLQQVPFMIMIHVSIYLVIILVKIIKHQRVGHINSWLLMLLGFLGLYMACYMAYYYMAVQPWFTLTHDYFVSLGMCASIVAIIFIAYSKQNILNGYNLSDSVRFENFYITYREPKIKTLDHPSPAAVLSYQVPVQKVMDMPKEPLTYTITDAEEKYKNSGLTEETIQELAIALELLMKKEKLYRECELKLETLSDKLAVSKHHLSQVINQCYGINFFEYVNMLRIEEAKHLLASLDKKSMNIIEVAYAVGYNTKNTFNSAFKRITGFTPTEYRSQKSA